MSTIAQSIEQTAINIIRTLVMDAVQAANSVHPGTPMALAPVGANPTRPIGRSAGSNQSDEGPDSLCQQVINAVTLSKNHRFRNGSEGGHSAFFGDQN